MKQIFIILCILFAVKDSLAQSNPETWQGTLRFNNVELRLVFRIFTEGDSLKGFLDSPDQGAKDIPVSKIIRGSDIVRYEVNSIKGFFEGKPEGDSVTGKWSQGGMNIPLTLKKTDRIEEVKRPQNPVKPYPYNEEEVFFNNDEAGIKLAGTFTWPKENGNFPAVVLVTGSGKQDRDETVYNHKPFLVLADYLTRKGIAVLRYDDRGAGKSTGDFSKATSMDFVSDALSAVKYLMTRNEVNKKKIGLAGHSEGGLIAPMASNRSGDIAFIVLMAGPGMKGDTLILLQSELISKAMGTDEKEIKANLESSRRIFNIIENETDTAAIREKIKSEIKKMYSKMTDEEKSKSPDAETIAIQQAAQLNSPWFKFFLSYDPYPELRKVKVPVLAINGENDLQVPAKQNLKLIEQALKEGKNKHFKIVPAPGLNHLFQDSVTGSVADYGKIEETFSPKAMEIIADWILKTSSEL